ncbi:SLC13 family permease [Echinicola vietnamensis]|uniref:Anion transporter n=1 Tax=Echinicola vietnamensis (strain DSM 17526 / LMG 23754 / KMM 6221) TaxID=926556 RepID=L0G431_ECHVK|nr:SLC13 family permease [Echinicola vietnamensis]AGA79771.1 anion transporter [Echinicola vietnamensis DSM 17526]
MNNLLWKRSGLVLGPVAFLLIVLFFNPDGLTYEAQAVLALAVWMAIWWILEAIPIAATALLPLVILPLTGALSMDESAAPYADPKVLLYMGGFMIAVTIEKWNLHKRIALSIISLIGTDMRFIVLGFMLATALLSMWISNTATSLMMLPIAVAVIHQLADGSDEISATRIGQALMLGIAYSASIGGLATIIGTPTNIVLVGIVKELYGIEIGFAEWMLVGLPISLGLLGICWWYLVSVAYPFPKNMSLAGGKVEIQRQLAAIGPISKPEIRVLLVFLLVSFSWITRVFLQDLLPFLNDTIIALVGVLLLFMLPSSRGKKRLLDWKTAEDIPWGILLLFGGGLALAAGFKETGLAAWLGSHFEALQGVHFLLFILIIVASVNFLTEITSNVATASMLLPILGAVALALGVHPYGLMVAATMAASCAFMLPVATPPNAVVFGSGYLTIPAMAKAGLWMNILSIFFITLFVYYIMPFLWGIDLKVYPF